MSSPLYPLSIRPIELDILKKGIGKQDQYMAAYGGLTVLNIHKNGKVNVEQLELKENEKAMRKDMKQQAAEMLELAGFRNVREYDNEYAMGLAIHEMGTARMGHDPKNSVLNKHNQLHAVPNIYVTDGSAMTSSGSQNPSLTYMALTARAANHAVEELKKMNL